jgi:predicted lipoprotein with Yx(FWY)xxD motif
VHKLLASRAARPFALVLPAAAVAAVIAGCGGGSSSGAAAQGGTPQRSTGATVMTRHTKDGTVLVDSQGRTLYLFDKDKGGTSNCYGACASIWPPLTTSGKPAAGTGAMAGKLGVSSRNGGGSVVTYAGHPLYTYVGDGKAGDVNGQGLDQFGAKWYVLSPAGREIDDD